MDQNKAHTATLNRISEKLGVKVGVSDPFDIRTPDMIVEVETSATIADAVDRLRDSALPAYIAVTNKEGLKFAQTLIRDTTIGLMDPRGEIVVASGVEHEMIAQQNVSVA